MTIRRTWPLGLGLAALFALGGACKQNSGGGGAFDTGGAGAGGEGPPPPSCSAGCPDGYTCQSGVCAGGDATMIDFDVTTFPFSGKLTVGGVRVNGQAPVGTCTGDQVRVALIGDHGAYFAAYIPCDATDGAFTARVAPGAYRFLASQEQSETSFPSDSTFNLQDAIAIP